MAASLGTPSAILVRRNGFGGDYEYYRRTIGGSPTDPGTPEFRPLSELASVYAALEGDEAWSDFENRIDEIACARSGDIVLVFDSNPGKYLSSGDKKYKNKGEHGSPSAKESVVPLVVAFRLLGDEELKQSNVYIKNAVMDAVGGNLKNMRTMDLPAIVEGHSISTKPRERESRHASRLLCRSSTAPLGDRKRVPVRPSA